MIELEGVPELVDPVMVAAFEGWNDAGDAASTAVGHMEREWKGEVFAALDAEDYYDFQVNRPQVWLDNGSRKVTWPTTRLAVVRVDDAAGKGKPRDLVLVRGIEPSMRWRSFCNEILGFAHELGVEMVVVLGALLGDTPHTRPVPVTGVTSDPDLARTMHLEESRYEGPTGIVGILQEACTHAGVPAVSLWASVPHYVSQPPNPKATLALLNRLEDLLQLNVPLGELQEDARAWQLGVDQLAAEDSEVAEYVQSLEEARDTAELPEASGEAIAKEFERYLRRRDGGNARDSGAGSPPGFGGEGTRRAPAGGRSRGAKPPSQGSTGDGRKDGEGKGDGEKDEGDAGEGGTDAEKPEQSEDGGEAAGPSKPAKPRKPAKRSSTKRTAKKTGDATGRGKGTGAAKSTRSGGSRTGRGGKAPEDEAQDAGKDEGRAPEEGKPAPPTGGSGKDSKDGGDGGDARKSARKSTGKGTKGTKGTEGAEEGADGKTRGSSGSGAGRAKGGKDPDDGKTAEDGNDSGDGKPSDE